MRVDNVGGWERVDFALVIVRDMEEMYLGFDLRT